MSDFDDNHLWDDYAAAVASGDEAETRRLAGDIVQFHLGFFTSYAKETAFPLWDEDTRTEYLHELVAVALEKVTTYDPGYDGVGGRKPAFVTYVKPYLRLVRYRLAGHDNPNRVGHETMRMRIVTQHIYNDFIGLDGVEPSHEDIASELSRRFGKPVTAARVRGLLAPPATVRGDESTGEIPGSVWDTLAGDVPTPEEQVVETLAQRERVSLVREALDTLTLDDMGKAIVEDRLMAESPVSLVSLAERFGYSASAVSAMEKEIAAALRFALGDAYDR